MQSKSMEDVDLAMLSNDERFAVTAERELLALLAAEPDSLRPYGDRIATFNWSDARDEAMAWAMLATPEGTAPAQVVSAAQRMVPEAAQILAGGRIAIIEDMNLDQKVDFLLNTVELASCRREVTQIRLRLQSVGTDSIGEDSAQLFRRATSLQRRIQDLERQLRSTV